MLHAVRLPQSHGVLEPEAALISIQRGYTLKSLAIAPAVPNSRSDGTGVTVSRISYHGWSDCLMISNGIVEAVVVPSIGRVMQLRHACETDEVFWENRALDGRLHEEGSKEWINFGGDKCWPAPQSAWPKMQGRAWPPPETFDARPLQAVVAENAVRLASSVDPDYGIGLVRSVELDQRLPVMRIRSEFHKSAGAPVRVAVWTITQMRDPERIFVLLPETTKFAEGYVRLIKTELTDLRRDGRMLSFSRNPRADVKIGTEASSLLWVGTDAAMRIDTGRAAGEYPDGGCLTEVYASPDPLRYVELETFSPLAEMKVGDRISTTTDYTLMRRSAGDVEAEARKAFGVTH